MWVWAARCENRNDVFAMSFMIWGVRYEARGVRWIGVKRKGGREMWNVRWELCVVGVWPLTRWTIVSGPCQVWHPRAMKTLIRCQRLDLWFLSCLVITVKQTSCSQVTCDFRCLRNATVHSPRCGLCFVGSKRHVDASNKYVGKFDINKPEQLFNNRGRK